MQIGAPVRLSARERELAIAGLDGQSVKSPQEFLRKLALILQVDYCEHFIDDIVSLPTVAGKDRILLVKFITKIRHRNKSLRAREKNEISSYTRYLLMPIKPRKYTLTNDQLQLSVNVLELVKIILNPMDMNFAG